MWAVLTSKLGLAGIACALVLGVIGVQTLRLSHAKSEIASMVAAQTVARADVARHEAQGVAISSEASRGLSVAQAGVVVKFKRLAAKVPEVDTADVDRDCRVPDSWVTLWNQGAQP